MLKIFSCGISKMGQSFLDEIRDVDWGDEDDFSPVPHGEPGAIDEENYEQYEPGEIEDPVEESIHRPVEPIHEQRQPYQFQEPELEEQPENAIEVASGRQLVYEGIDNNEIISFDYTTRHGQYAGTRKVEPHYTFIAQTTGNEILVSFDHTRNDIRAFIVGNVHPYGVRYKDENFEPRREIMQGVY